MDAMIKNKHWEKIFSVIQRSYVIENHLEFFSWLQNDVNEFLPHDVLVACWGDFEKKTVKSMLNYVVASNLSDINTQAVFDSNNGYDVCMLHLHQLWLDNNRCWLVVNNLYHHEVQNQLQVSLPNNLEQLNSLMVYGISDVRGSNVCLYVFFSKEKMFDVPDSVMGLIMPHIDNVLRKIQHLKPLKTPAEPAIILDGAGLSVRELEIIHWIKSGKTNHEIATILTISQNTVKSHLKRVFQKMNVTRRAQAVAILMNKLY
jgi:transcriptional regulator EpsA